MPGAFPDVEPRNPSYALKVQQIFERAPFIRKLGIRIQAVAPGKVETTLAVEPWQLQQNGYAHAGVIASLADHTAGAAAATLVEASQGVLSVEFKVNFLRAGKGEILTCRAHVLKAGRTLSVVESEVFGEEGSTALIAKATVTLAVVPDTTDPSLAA
jgi:uncharacterized protein (TIGR00369 family)